MKTGDDYKLFLLHELETRKSRNKAYSSRAFARDLGMSPAYLSYVLTGQKVPTEERAIQIAETLCWDFKRQKLFSTLVRMSRIKDKRFRDRIKEDAGELIRPITNFKRISQDVFKLISNWYHFAIIELAKLPSAKTDPHWIAERLGITLDEVITALSRLERMGLLRRSKNKWIIEEPNYTTGDIPSEAIQEYHRQILKKASQALRLQSDQRDFSSITVRTTPKKLKEAKARLKQFRRDMMEFLEEGEDATNVYNLSIQLFPLDKGRP